VTSAPAAAASDVPLRQPGLHTRSGNAMARTRSNLLDAAAHCVERYGVRRTTMGDIALKAVVAKATLYNHFRTKDDVLTALATSRATALAQTCRASPAASRCRARPAWRRPTSARASRRLCAPPRQGSPRTARSAGWCRRARAGRAARRPGQRPVVGPRAGAGRRGARGRRRAGRPRCVAVVLRWLTSLVLAPAEQDEAVLAAGLLAEGLLARTPVSESSPAGAGPAQPGT
jgi:AcrR family transcriptional regulator